MDTSFNQNLPASGFDSETVQYPQRLEQRLEVCEARTRCLLATLPQIVWIAKVNGEITNFNQRWYEYTGLTVVESLGWDFLKALHPEDRDRLVASCNLASKKLQSYEIECRILGRDGIYRWFIGQRMPVIGATGQVLEWVGIYTLKEQPEQHSAASWQENTEVLIEQGNPSAHRVELTTQLTALNQPQTNLRVRKQKTHNWAEFPKQRLRNLVNQLSHAIVWEADTTTEQFTFVSQSAERLLGYPVEQWLSEPDFWVNLIHPEDRQWTVALSRKKMFQNRDYELEYRCLAADNRVVWLRDRAYVVRDDQSQGHKRRGLMVDITLAKQAETELQSHIRQQGVLAQLGQQALMGTEISTLIDESVSLVAQTLAIEYCTVLELLPDGNTMRLRAGVGWPQELVGQAIIEANTNTHAGYTLHSRQPVVLEDLRRETRFQGSPLLHNHNIISGISVIIQATPFQESLNISDPNTSYRPFGVLGAHSTRRRAFSRTDIDFLQAVAHFLGVAIKCQQADEALYETRAKLGQTTAALNQATASLEKRNCELDQFAYVTSHDLKAPLRAIANLSEWIEEDISDQLNEENLHQMQLMRGRVYRLEALINGLLQYSRAGRLTTKPESVDVATLLTQVIDELAPPAQFTIELAPGMPTLFTERLALQQVFTHLIDNAIKHHPRSDGTVKISVQDLDDAYEFAVADDGAGIAPRFHEKVFVIFQILQARDTVENTGVGLAIAKRIVESQGGTIRLESQEGQGATFYFTWPKQSSGY